MPTKKYEWSFSDVASSLKIDELIASAHQTNVGVAEELDNIISYNRVRDIRKGLKAPVRLSEFLMICQVCEADPVETLRQIIDLARRMENEQAMRDRQARIENIRARAVTLAANTDPMRDIESETPE